MTSIAHGSIGVIGTGSIARSVAIGLSDATDPPSIHLSPRNTDVAEELARQFPNVTVCASNEEVVETSPCVLLAVRPQVWLDAVQGLPWRPDHSAISFIAGVNLGTLREALGDVAAIARAIPLPSVARREGVTVTYRADVWTRSIFDRLGETLDTDDEGTFDAFSAASATVAAHIAYLQTISGWLTQHSVASHDADRYVASVFANLADSLRESPVDLAALSHEHATPGGLNENLRRMLAEAGMWDAVQSALDQTLHSVTGRD